MKLWLLTLGSTAALVALVWLGAITQAEVPAFEAKPPPALVDFFAYYRPNAERAFARLRAGEIPLWDNQQALGGPFLATLQTGVLYPPNLLHTLLPVQTAFCVLTALHLALAAALAGAFAGALGAGRFGSALAGFGFALSSHLCSASWTPPILWSAAWLPGVLLGVDRVIRRPTAGRAACLAGVIGLQALAGWPYMVLMTCALAALYSAAALGEQVARERRVPFAGVLALLAAALLGFAFASPQFLPARALTAQSSRALGLLDATQAIFIGNKHDPAVFLSVFLRRGVNDGIPGLGLLLFAPFAVLIPGPARVRCAALLAVVVLALMISFADHTPLYRGLRRLPLFGDFRFPMRYRLLSTFGLSVCGGVGAGRAFAQLRPRAPKLAYALACFALLAAGGQAVAVVRAQPPFPRAETAAPPDLRLRALEAVAATGPPLARALWDRQTYRERLGVRVPLLNDLEPLSLENTARAVTFLQRGEASTLERFPGVPGAAPFFGRAVLPQDAARTPLLDALAVRFLVAEEPPAWLRERYPVRSSFGGRPLVFENPTALPRAYRVTRAEPTPADPQAALERLVAPDFDVHRSVLLDPLPGALADARSVDLDPAGEVEITLYTPERVLLETRGRSAGIVVLCDAYSPDWEARVDDAPVKVLRANTVGRAVVVGPGTHRIEFVYRPFGFRIGVALAAVAVLVCAGVALRALGRRGGERDGDGGTHDAG
ncbi:MAG TPA: YfhO family protein [Myxococcota bacterium]|nr:YfhO family protein [Myxococcota bacterium]